MYLTTSGDVNIEFGVTPGEQPGHPGVPLCRLGARKRFRKTLEDSRSNVGDRMTTKQGLERFNSFWFQFNRFWFQIQQGLVPILELTVGQRLLKEKKCRVKDTISLEISREKKVSTN